MPHRLVVVAGVPPAIEGPFATAFSKLATQELVEPTVVSAYSLCVGYTEDYANEVYEKLVYKLKGRRRTEHKPLLAETNLIVLFLQKRDGSDTVLFGKFGIEAFVTPMSVPQAADLAMDTRGQRGYVVGQLIRDARRAIRHARRMLPTIYEDLNSRENKTCLLLPPKTFGRGFSQIRRRVWDAAINREEPGKFARDLKTLDVAKDGKHYVGQGGLVYRSPSKAGPRHGLAPVWEDDHQPSCVIRGRLRFGVPFDPRFHYDCQMPQDWHRQFPGCHEPQQLPRKRRHANCAPNDNVR